MIQVVNPISSVNNEITVLGRWSKLTPVKIRVLNGGSIFISSNRNELLNVVPSTSGAQSQGIEIAAGDGLVEFWWEGDMLATANIETFVCIVAPDSPKIS